MKPHKQGMRTKFQLMAVTVCCVGMAAGASANTNLMARLENSLKAAREVTNVEIVVSDKLEIRSPEILKSMKSQKDFYWRTFQFTYIASGEKFHAINSGVVGSSTNLAGPSETGYDGSMYRIYEQQYNRMVTESVRKPHQGNMDQSPHSPLIAALSFLALPTDDGSPNLLMFTEARTGNVRDGLGMEIKSINQGVITAEVRSSWHGTNSERWEILIDEAGDSFKPRMLRQIINEKSLLTMSLTDYTNIGPYEFPSRISTYWTSYPPKNPPQVQMSNYVALISVKSPAVIADSEFRLAEQEKKAKTIWSWDKNDLVDASGKAIPRPPRPKRDPIYDETADGQQQLDAALDAAKKAHKNVFIEFGDNQCSWCYKLHDLLTTNAEVHAALEKSYDFVLIDVSTKGNRKVEKKYGNPEFGRPTVSVLDGDGKVLVVQNTGKMVEDNAPRPDANKWMAFLKTWAPKE